MAALTTAAVLGGSAIYSANQASKAADAQVKSGRAAIAEQEAARNQAREDLSPYAEFGERLLPELESRLTSPVEQITYDSITTDPLYEALFSDATNKISASQAAKGKLGSGETLADLTNASLVTGANIVNQRLNRERQATMDLYNAIGIGQNAAAGQGSATLQTGANISDLNTQIGNVRGAEDVSKANIAAKTVNQGIGLYDLIEGY